MHRGAEGTEGPPRRGGPFATADARLVLALLVITAVVVTVWIGFERRRPDASSAPVGAAVIAAAVPAPRVA
ncbi:MAG: hypothetical protein ACR2JF_13145 [Iamia sp.]